MTRAPLLSPLLFLLSFSPAAREMQSRNSAAAAPTPPSPTSAAAAIDRCDALLMTPLEAFERRGDVSNARRVLAAARAARDLLEATRLPSSFANARSEELIFFNHVIPGVAAYLQVEDGPAARAALASILRRGRAHRERGRAALRAAIAREVRAPAASCR